MNTRFKLQRYKRLTKMQKRMLNNLRTMERTANIKVIDFNWDMTRLIVRTLDGRRWQLLDTPMKQLFAMMDGVQIFHIGEHLMFAPATWVA